MSAVTFGSNSCGFRCTNAVQSIEREFENGLGFIVFVENVAPVGGSPPNDISSFGRCLYSSCTARYVVRQTELFHVVRFSHLCPQWLVGFATT